MRNLIAPASLCRWSMTLLLCALPWAGLKAHSESPPQVLVLGTWHFDNPNLDHFNVDAADVLDPAAQRALQQLTDALLRMKPTKVMVESPAGAWDEKWQAYVDGTLEPQRNEVVQIGFRLARAAGLDGVLGIDAEGSLQPAFDALFSWASSQGRSEELQALLAPIGEWVDAVGERAARDLLGTLREVNTSEVLADGHAFYASLQRFGSREMQPGAELLAAWYRRNALICAKLLQALEPGDRAVVVFGQGHAYLPQRCVQETPGVEWVPTLRYLDPEG